MTAREHLEFYARAKGIEDVAADVDIVLAKVGLAAYASRLAAKLSGGNKRKLSLAIALPGTFSRDIPPHASNIVPFFRQRTAQELTFSKATLKSSSWMSHRPPWTPSLSAACGRPWRKLHRAAPSC